MTNLVISAFRARRHGGRPQTLHYITAGATRKSAKDRHSHVVHTKVASACAAGIDAAIAPPRAHWVKGKQGRPCWTVGSRDAKQHVGGERVHLTTHAPPTRDPAVTNGQSRGASRHYIALPRYTIAQHCVGHLTR